MTCTKTSNTTSSSSATTATPVIVAGANATQPKSDVTNSMFSLPGIPSNIVVDSLPTVKPVSQDTVNPMFSVPELSASNTIAAANPEIQPSVQGNTSATFSVSAPEQLAINPILSVPELPSSIVVDSLPTVKPVSQDIRNEMLLAPDLPANIQIRATNSSIQPVMQEETKMFSVPNTVLNNKTDSDSAVKANIQAATNPLFPVPEVQSKSGLSPPTSTIQSPEQGEPHAMFLAPQLRTNVELGSKANMEPVMHDTLRPLLLPPKLPPGNEVASNRSSTAGPPNTSENQLLSTNLESDTSAMQSSAPTERITGAILFPGNWGETKQKNYQNLNLVNHSNSSNVGQTLNVESVHTLSNQPVENATEAQTVKAVADTLNLETVDVAPVLSKQNSNVSQIIQAVEKNISETSIETRAKTISVESATLPSLSMAMNANISENSITRLSSNVSALGTVENTVDITTSNAIENADVTMSNKTTSVVEMNETKVDSDSSLISVPLLRSKINLKSNSMSGNSINELSSDIDFLTALEGILPVIAQNLNKTRTDQTSETNITENGVESNQSSGTLETGSQLFSNPRTSSDIKSINSNINSVGRISLNANEIDTKSIDNNVETHQSNGTLETGSQLFPNPRTSSDIKSINSNINSVGRISLNANEIDTESPVKTMEPSVVLLTSTAASSDSTISQKKTSGLATSTMPTNRVADSILRSFVQDGLLRLSDEMKQQPTDSLAETQNLTAINKSEFSTTMSSHQETTTVSSSISDNNMIASSSVDIRTVRIEDQPPQEPSIMGIILDTSSSEVTTTSSASEESTIFSVSPTTQKRQDESTAETTPEPMGSTTLSMTESRSTRMSNTPFTAATTSNKDKQDTTTATATISDSTTVQTNITRQSDRKPSSTQSTPSVTSKVGNLSIKAAVDTMQPISNMSATGSSADVLNVAITNPDAFAPLVISGLATETVEPPTQESIPDLSADKTTTNQDLSVAEGPIQPADADLTFKIVRLLKFLTVKSALQTLLESGLNGTSIETTTALNSNLDNLDSQQVNQTQLIGDIAIVNNVDRVNTDFETATIAENSIGDRNSQANGQMNGETSMKTTTSSVSETKTINQTTIASNRNRQPEIRENITEPSDSYAKTMSKDITETVQQVQNVTETTSKTIQTTKKSYSVIVETESDKQPDSDVISNEVDTSLSTMEDDPDLFGIDRKALSKYFITVVL